MKYIQLQCLILKEWSSESTLGASERMKRHRLHHHHHYYHHHHHHSHHAASHPRYGTTGERASVPAGAPGPGQSGIRSLPTSAHASHSSSATSAMKKHPTSGSMRQVASADEASDSEEIDVCETCSEWLSKALLCSCQVPSSASSSPSQGQQQQQEQILKQAHHLKQEQMLKQQQARISYQYHPHRLPSQQQQTQSGQRSSMRL